MPPPAAQARREVVLILGMHRSGTSALAGALIAAGGRGPAFPMPESDTNVTGYHEPMSFYKRHSEILAAAGSHWTDWRPFTSLDAHRADDDNANLMKDFAAEFGDEGWIVFKDPRLCKLMGVWAPLFARHRLAPCPVLLHRHPREVAASLTRRNEMSEAEGLMLWLSYAIEAERATRGQRRVFLTYEDVLRKPEAALARIGAAFGLFPFTAGRYDVNPTLRHHQANAETKLPEPVATVFAIFNRWAVDGEDAADYRALDRAFTLLAALSRTIPVKGDILPATLAFEAFTASGDDETTEFDGSPTMTDGSCVDPEDIKRAHEAVIGGLRSQLAEVDAEVTAIRQRFEAQTRDVVGLTTLLMEAKAEAETAHLMVKTAEDRAAAAHYGQLQSLQHTVSELKAARAAYAARVEEQEKELRTLRGALAEAEGDGRLQSLQKTVSELKAARAAYAARVAEQEKELRALRDALAEAEGDGLLQSLQKTLSELKAARDSYAARVEGQQKEVGTLLDPLAKAEMNLRSLSGNRSSRLTGPLHWVEAKLRRPR